MRQIWDRYDDSGGGMKLNGTDIMTVVEKWDKYDSSIGMMLKGQIR